MDCYQPSGSFKIRGIGHLCAREAQKGSTGFISSSGGNAGLAAAYAGLKLSIPTTIIVPTTTPEHVRKRICSLGAEVRIHGKVWDESDTYAREYAEQHQLSYIHPFDDPYLWEGHASLVKELQNQGPKPDLIICSVGGGGLLCGIAQGLWENNWKDVPIMAVETIGAASLHASVQAGQLVSLDAITSIAKTLGARRVASKALEWTHKHPISCVQVEDRQAIKSCIEILDDTRALVEPACGAAYAALGITHPLIENSKNIVVVMCGGSGVDTQMLLSWKHHITDV